MATTDTWDSPALDQPINADLPAIKNKFQALVKGDPSLVQKPPVGAKRLVEIDSGNWQVQQYNGRTWSNIGKLKMDVDTVDGYDAAITPQANTIAVRNASGKLEGGITGNAVSADSAVTLSETLGVELGGTGATTSEAARANLGVPPTSHVSTATTYGAGNATQYGHVKLSDATNNLSGVSGGVAATPAAVKAAKDAADAAQSSANSAMTKASTLATASAPGIVKPGTGMTVATNGALNVNTASTSETGIVQLNDTVTSTSTRQAATANAVKTAYDKAVEAEAAIANALSVGALLPSFATSMRGYLLCNGAAVSRTTYASLFAILGTAFGAGNGSTTFNLPDIRDKTLWGANGNLMKVLAAGAPEIDGDFVTYNSTSVVVLANGAFSKGAQSSLNASTTGGTGHANEYKFKASDANSIYGSSDTIQPPAIAVNIFIKY